MKHLIIFALILAIIVPNILCFCDTRDQRVVKVCHETFNEDPGSKLKNSANKDLVPLKDEKYCKALLARSKCLEKVDNSCLDPEQLARAAGEQKPKILDILFYDYSYQFICLSGYKTTKADQKCSDASVMRQACPPVPLFLIKSKRDCEAKKKELDCRKKTLEEKCKNKDFVQFQDDKDRWATEEVLPQCNFNFNIKIKAETPEKKGIFGKIRGIFG